MLLRNISPIKSSSYTPLLSKSGNITAAQQHSGHTSPLLRAEVHQRDNTASLQSMRFIVLYTGAKTTVQFWQQESLNLGKKNLLAFLLNIPNSR